MKNKIKGFWVYVYIILSICVTVIALHFDGKPDNKKIKPSHAPIIEGYPRHIIERYKSSAINLTFQRTFKRPNRDSIEPQYVRVEKTKLWKPGTTVTVSFKGGSADLHKKIADIAKEWTKYGNLKLDFGFDPKTQKYRKWDSTNIDYHNHNIRISFDQKGYWSVVGNESINPKLVKAWEASMNFEGFTEYLPKNYYITVLHEFGHALGFHHAHFDSIGDCDNEFDWDKVYKIYKKKYDWDPPQVNFNVRILPKSADLKHIKDDPRSIMRYFFPPSVFKKGKNSKCYTPRNITLSEGDKMGMAEALYSIPDSTPVELKRR